MSGYGRQEVDLYIGTVRHAYVPSRVLVDTHELALITQQALHRGRPAPEWDVLGNVIRNDWQIEIGSETINGSFGIVHAGVRAAVSGTVAVIESAIEGFAARYPSIG